MSPVTQTARIQIRRGLYVNLPVLASGELGWATDTQQLFIGTGTNNILIAGSIGNISLGGNGLPVVSSTITGNAASALATGITGPAANVGGLITYTINNAGVGRAGIFSYATNSANSLVWDDEYEGANLGIIFSASLISSNTVVSLNYTAGSLIGNIVTINATVNSL